MRTGVGEVPVPGPMATAATITSRAIARGNASSTGLLFGGFMLLTLVEWIGVANYVPPLRQLRLSTLLAYGLVAAVLLKFGSDVFRFRQVRLHLGFVIFTAASCLWAVVTRHAFESIRPHVDYFGLLILTACLMDRPGRFRMWSLVSTVIIVTLVALNLDILTSSVRQGVFRAGYFMGDGNDFGWGLVVLFPFALYLVVGPHPAAMRSIGVIGALAAVIGVAGTQSRGAALAIAASLLYFGFVAVRQRALVISLLMVLALGAALAAPTHYVDRLRSIGNVEEDNSAQGRLRAWRAAAQMAVDFPLGVGAGNFNSAFGRYYVPQSYEGWGSQRWISAHSVYFKVLGEYGVGGLMLLVSIIVVNFRMNLATRRRARDVAASGVVPDVWPGLLNMSLLGYCISGMFLGGIAYPHLYLLSGLTLGAFRASGEARVSDGGQPGEGGVGVGAGTR
jgi:probable O-glycosylation ligase (exosortase A-associated)